MRGGDSNRVCLTQAVERSANGPAGGIFNFLFFPKQAASVGLVGDILIFTEIKRATTPNKYIYRSIYSQRLQYVAS